MVSAVKETYGQQPDKVLADKGYCCEANLAGLTSCGVDGYVALGREGRKAVSVNPETGPTSPPQVSSLVSDYPFNLDRNRQSDYADGHNATLSTSQTPENALYQHE